MRTRHLNGLLIVAVLIVSTASLYAQRQQQNVAKLKADARNAVGIIGGDKAKTQTYCQIVGLGRQMNQAVGEKNLKKARATAQEIVQLRKQLPEFVVLENVVERVDLNSPDGREIAFASLGMALQSRLVLLLHRTGIELHPINVIRLARDDRISSAILPLSRDDGARNDGQGLRPPGRGSRRHGGPMMMRMMFSLMDADGDGKLSLQEFQAAHERIFKAMDANKDGFVTIEEMQDFIRGTSRPASQH